MVFNCHPRKYEVTLRKVPLLLFCLGAVELIEPFKCRVLCKEKVIASYSFYAKTNLNESSFKV